MRKIIVLVIFMTLTLSVLAQLPEKRYNNLPQGTFKKARNGKIIQYDKNGKKVGVYKLNSEKRVNIKK